MLHRCGACHGASDAKVRKSGLKEKLCLVGVECICVFSYPFFLPGLLFIYTCLCVCAGVLLLYPLAH